MSFVQLSSLHLIVRVSPSDYSCSFGTEVRLGQTRWENSQWNSYWGHPRKMRHRARRGLGSGGSMWGQPHDSQTLQQDPSFCSWHASSLQWRGWRLCSRSFSAPALFISNGSTSWPGIEYSRRWRSHVISRPHLPPLGTHTHTHTYQPSAPQWDGLWNISAFTPWGLYETGLMPPQKGFHTWPGIHPFWGSIGKLLSAAFGEKIHNTYSSVPPSFMIVH